jgi:hypothetical protein
VTLVSPRLAQVPSQVIELGRFPTPANLISKHSVSALAGRRKIELPNAREYAWYKATWYLQDRSHNRKEQTVRLLIEHMKCKMTYNNKQMQAKRLKITHNIHNYYMFQRQGHHLQGI